jgi:hypothetical protein
MAQQNQGPSHEQTKGGSNQGMNQPKTGSGKQMPPNQTTVKGGEHTQSGSGNK